MFFLYEKPFTKLQALPWRSVKLWGHHELWHLLLLRFHPSPSRLSTSVSQTHRQGNYKDTNFKMLSLLVFIRVYILETHVGIFDPCCETVAPLPSLWPPPRLPPSRSKHTVHADSVRLWGGVLSCVVDHILQEHSVSDQIQNLKIATPPQTKNHFN